jgi:hypothetical protein
VSENVEDPFNPPAKEDYRQPRKSYAAHQQYGPTKPRGNERPTPTSFVNGSHVGPPRRGLASFQGSWDDLVTGKIKSAPAAEGLLSPSVRSSSSTTLPELPIQCDVALNCHGDRIDLPLPPVSDHDKNRLKSRTEDRKLCNEHHLRRACHNEQCRYDHEPIDAGILLALRHLTRTQACVVGQGCRMSDCAFGHHCPNRNGGKECKNSKCSFKKMSLHHVRNLKVVEIIPAPRR